GTRCSGCGRATTAMTTGAASGTGRAGRRRRTSRRWSRSCGMIFETAQLLPSGIVSEEPVRIYTGILGQIGDIIMFTATVRRLKELFPRSQITFAVSERYRGAGELVAGLPY